MGNRTLRLWKVESSKWQEVEKKLKEMLPNLLKLCHTEFHFLSSPGQVFSARATKHKLDIMKGQMGHWFPSLSHSIARIPLTPFQVPIFLTPSTGAGTEQIQFLGCGGGVWEVQVRQTDECRECLCHCGGGVQSFLSHQQQESCASPALPAQIIFHFIHEDVHQNFVQFHKEKVLNVDYFPQQLPVGIMVTLCFFFLFFFNKGGSYQKAGLRDSALYSDFPFQSPLSLLISLLRINRSL